jgi:hypothetical protein
MGCTASTLQLMTSLTAFDTSCIPLPWLPKHLQQSTGAAEQGGQPQVCRMRTPLRHNNWRWLAGRQVPQYHRQQVTALNKSSGRRLTG